MPDPFSPLFAAPAPSAERPLSGVTLLLVEDSRFASEAVRLLCLRCGARIRRADSLRAAERHLATYRPTIVLIDLGLPDGSGIDLIRRLASATPRLPAILAISGDESGREAALEAGADAFVAKPILSLAEFQAAIGKALSLEPVQPHLRLATSDDVAPDPIAYRDDLGVISDLLTEASDARSIAYAAQFLAGVARAAEDEPLVEAALSLSQHLSSGAPMGAQLARVAGLVEHRLHGSGAVPDGPSRQFA